MGEYELERRNMEIAAKEVANAEKALAVVRRFLPGVLPPQREGLDAALASLDARMNALKSRVRYGLGRRGSAG